MGEGVGFCSFAKGTPTSAKELQALITKGLPRIDLVDVIIEVDHWTRFSNRFEHVSNEKPMKSKDMRTMYAALLAESNNHGLKKMAEITGIPYAQLQWFTHWHLREESIQGAINDLVDFQFQKLWPKHGVAGPCHPPMGNAFPCE